MKISKSYLKALIYEVTGAAIEVHRELGPGLLEGVYHRCMEEELIARGLFFQSELVVPVRYKNLRLDAALRCDLFVERVLPVELKAVELFHPVHVAQLITYMKLLNAPKGLLLNFNVSNISKEGQRAYVNELYRALPD